MKKIYLYYAAIFLFTISMADTCRCGGNKNKECPTYYLSQDIKDYCVFKEGSWWVYENQVTKTRDSIVLYSNVFENFDCGRNIGYNWEVNTQKFKIIGSNQVVRDSIFERWAVSVTENFSYYSDIQGAMYFSTDKSNDVFNTLKYKYIGDYKIENQLYKDVKLFEEDFNNDSRFIYFSKNIGIIQRRYRNGTEQSLKSYKVVQ